MIEHRLFVLMAQNRIKSLAELAAQAKLSYNKLVNFANKRSKFIDPEVLAGLCIFFDCGIEELLVIKKVAS